MTAPAARGPFPDLRTPSDPRGRDGCAGYAGAITAFLRCAPPGTLNPGPRGGDQACAATRPSTNPPDFTDRVCRPAGARMGGPTAATVTFYRKGSTMGNMPPDRNALLTFALGHQDNWKSRASQIGLTEPEAEAVKDNAVAVQEQLALVASLRAQSKAATADLTDRFTDLRRSVSDALRDINAFAAASSNPSAIYNLAEIEPPQPRSVLQPPAKPTNLTFTLDPATGGIIVRWKCTNPQGVFGVVYTVQRRIGANGPLTTLGATGEKRFVDTTIPAGTSLIVYSLFGQRGGVTGPTSDAVQVRFGTGSNGEMIVSSVKIAA